MRIKVAKSIACVCAAALLTGLVSPVAQAGELKPLKGWAYRTSRVYLAEVPDDPYLQGIVDTLGPPAYVQAVTQINFNNVAGKCEDLFVEIGYIGLDTSTGKEVNHFYASGVTVAANGDTIKWTHAGLSQLEEDPITFEYVLTIVGGTGRFEGAWGMVWGQGSGPYPYPSAYEGVMSTVGSLKRDK